jgi:hypothetical protein
MYILRVCLFEGKRKRKENGEVKTTFSYSSVLVGFGIFHLGPHILYSLNPVKNWKENMWFDLD